MARRPRASARRPGRTGRRRNTRSAARNCSPCGRSWGSGSWPGIGISGLSFLFVSRHRHRAEEALRVGVAHGAEHVADRARLDRLARIHHRHRVAGFEDEAEIVRDEQRRCAGAGGQVLDQRDDAGFDRDVERGRRLVEDQQLSDSTAAPSRSRPAAAGRRKAGADRRA